MSDYWKKKMDELEEEKKKTTSQSYWDRKTAELKNEKKTTVTKKDDDDIAPIKSAKEEKGLFDFFQKGAFEDGYQFGDVTKNILGTVADAGMNAVKGIAGIGEGIGDFISYGVAGVADKMGEDAFARGVRQKAQENLFDNLLKPAEDYLDKYSILGRTSDSIMQGVGQVGAIMATGGLGASAGLGSAGVTALTTGLMGVSGAGSGMSEAYRGGANDLQAFKHGLNSGAADALSELIFGGLGKSLNAVGFSKGLSSADDMLAKLASSKLKNQVSKNIVEFGIKAGAEGLEEVIAGVAQAYSKYNNYLKDQGMDFADVLKDENLLEQFVVGALTSGVVQAPGLNIANKTGTDFITGRTQNEQAVVDREVENRIAEAEEDGTKLTAKEKNAIQEQVEKDLEKGYISTDLIEEVVGGETFQTYKSQLDEETKLQQEFDTLNKMKQGEMTGEQMDRRTELKDLLAANKEKPKSGQLRMLLDQEVAEGIKGSRLTESYNEQTRRGQKFEADLTRYDEKQKAVIQKAIDSGILNNTNRTHEFVDMVAKISADKGVLFDFTNNEKLKTSAFAVDGKAVNGFVTKDGITINMQSAKALNTIVGHEITHVLEGTDLYTELQNAVVEYAKTKGDYQGRFDSLSRLYEAVEGADINAELTADLVGDYLFTDPDFIHNLSTNHRNVFQKIYDEVKYLLKVATAGSKEARQLEKVKRAFEKAYREGENARESEEISDSKTKYSIREEAPPKNTGVAYKVFYVKDGKLYPPMVANPGGADTPMGVWLNADMGTAAPPSKTGRAQVKAGGKGTQGGGGSLAFRPGWHLGDLPRASQFDRVNPETGNKELFPENFVWAEVEYAKDVDYQEEAMSYGYTDNGKFRHAYAGLPRLPENGYYRYRTNPKPDTVPWVITGAMKVNRLLSDAEVNAILEKNGVPPVHRQGGDVGLDKFGFKEDGTVKYSLSDSEGNKLTEEQAEYFRSSKMRDENGNLKVMYHGSKDGGFHVFDKRYSDDHTSFFFVDSNDVASSYSGTSETYAARSFRTAEDFNKFFAEIGTEEYEVKEEDGKFHLYEDGDVVAESATAEGIYEEFRDWSGLGYGDVNYKVYLNLTNPLEVDAGGNEWNEIQIPEEHREKFNKIIFRINHPKKRVDTATTRNFAEYANAQGYDGVIFKNILDVGGYGGKYDPHTVAIAFDGSQVKSVANENPTANKDIRYSLSDNEGNQLSEGQAEYFKDTKIKDKKGNIKVMYHGTANDFTVFNPMLQGGKNGTAEGYGLYFADTPLVTESYGDKQMRGYLNVKNPATSYKKTITNSKLVKLIKATCEAEAKEFVAAGDYDNIRDAIKDTWISNYVDTYGVPIATAYRECASSILSMNHSDMDIIQEVMTGNSIRSYEAAYEFYDILKSTMGIDGYVTEWKSDSLPEGKAQIVVAFDSNQFKNADNLNPTSDPDIRFSQSKDGKPYGRWNVYSKDVLLETAPVQEEAAPTVSEMESVAPVAISETETTTEAPSVPVAEEADLFPDDLAPTQQELEYLQAEAADIQGAMEAMAAVGDVESVNRLIPELEDVQKKIAALQAEDAQRVATLDDADAPPEMEAPYQAESDPAPVEDPFDDRDWYEVSKRNVKAYMYENPEVKPFFQDEALALMSELNDTTKGERFYSEEAFAREGNESAWTGVSRHTSKSIETLLDSWHMSYADIEKGLNAIIEDHGEENIAAAKKIEFMLNDRLLNGYTDFYTNKQVPPNQDYVNLLAEMEITAYSQEAFERLLATADQYAPPAQAEDIAPVKQGYVSASGEQMKLPLYPDPNNVSPAMGEVQTEGDIAPVFEVTARKGVPEGQQAFLEPDAKADAIAKKLAKQKAILREEYLRTRAEKQKVISDKNAYISNRAMELYQELRGLKKGVKASEALGYLLDHGAEWSSVRAALVNIRHTPGSTVNQNSAIENIAREMLANDYEDKVYELNELDAEYKRNVEQLEADAEKALNGESLEKFTRKQLHENIVNGIKATFAENGFDFDKVLKNAKNLSTFATVDNTPQRVMEKALGYKEGGILADITVNQVAQNETKGIQWLNSFTDRKNGLLAKLSKQYGIKPGSKESAAAQMYAEGFYVGKNDVIIKYGDAELAADFPDRVKQAQIKGLAKDKSIRRIYDDTLKAINESRTRNAYPEIPRLDNYFLHFRAMNDTFSRLGLPFNPNDIRAKDLPTDLNGVTADLKPGQPFFASAMHREGKRTDFDLLGGLEQYLTSAKNQIYHIDDIQTLRALRNYIADTYGQANGLSDLDLMSEEEAQERIKDVYGSHLSTFAKFLNEEANVLAGKTALIDRGVEGIIGRRGITFLDTVNKQVGKNMVGFNVSSSMTNFISVVQAFAKANKFDFVKALSQTAASKLKALGGVTDSFVENNPTIIRRKGAEKFFKTPYEKVSDAGYFLMSAVDNLSTEVIVRAKYNELTRKGMDQQKAAFEADKWVSRLMGDRSLGQQPQLYNSKMLGLLTKFQLEVRNQLDSQFYDTIQEAKVSSEHIENRLLRNAKTAAKVGSTFFQLAVLQHVFGKAFESVAGYNPAFDIIEALVTAFGWDDDEEDEDTVLDNIEEGFMVLLEDLPYSSTFTGGRIPISSALPVKQFITGKDQYGNEKSRVETLAEAAPYYIAPGGYGQLKKTVAGLKMFSDEHPIAGSYTDSGNLRFPVEDTLGNRVQAAVFGQWASGNARDYFDNERKALNPKQTQELIDVGISIQDYWKYREGLSGLSTLEQKLFYIDSLNLTTAQKNVLANNLTDRKEAIDMTDFDEFGSLSEFDYANDNPEKYAFFGKIGITYEQYQKADDDTKEAYDWAFKYPAKYQVSKAVSDDYLTFWQYKQDLSKLDAKDENGETVNGLKKERVIDYINNLDMDYGQRIILYRSMYNSQADRDDYNSDILDYLNSRDDLSYEEKVSILKELDFTVTDDGDVYWE